MQSPKQKNPLFTVIPLLRIIIKITKTKFCGHNYLSNAIDTIDYYNTGQN